ncbi:hypothetical protein GR268_46535 [Rhizobium leguminosarum]|nr:hypothetical protein [Rhizobium leguminosarum]
MGKTTRCNSSDDEHHHNNTRWNARNVGEPYQSDDEDGDVDRTKRERRGAVVEALALSPRSGHGFGGGRPPNARCARAQLAALPYALTAFESPER